jgi:hypothetical protein
MANIFLQASGAALLQRCTQTLMIFCASSFSAMLSHAILLSPVSGLSEGGDNVSGRSGWVDDPITGIVL